MSDFSETATNDEFTFFLGEDQDRTAVEEPKLTALDTRHRCDRCPNSQAYVVVVGQSGKDILFCKHHFEKHYNELSAQGFTVTVDERDKLLARGNEVHA